MAKLHEEIVVLKISKLLKDGEAQELILSAEMREALTMMVEQLLGEEGSKLLIEVVDLGE
jgi:hypothetical protein